METAQDTYEYSWNHLSLMLFKIQIPENIYCQLMKQRKLNFPV